MSIENQLSVTAILMLILCSPAFAQNRTAELPISPGPPAYMPYTAQPHGLDFDYFTAILNERDLRVTQRFSDLEKYLNQRLVDVDNAVTFNIEAERRGRTRSDADTLTHFDARIGELEKLIAANLASEKEARMQALSSAQVATDKADKATETHFASVNEFRQTLSDQTSKFPSRIETDAKLSALEGQIAALTKIQDQTLGKSEGVSASWVVGMAVVGFLVELATLGALIAAKNEKTGNVRR